MQVVLRIVNNKCNVRLLRLQSPETIIGRGAGCQLKVVSDQISRKHCKIIIDGQRVTIQDLGSVNGTFVNEQQISPNVEVPLFSGARVALGSLRFSVEYEATTISTATASPAPQIDESAATVTFEAIPESIGAGHVSPAALAKSADSGDAINVTATSSIPDILLNDSKISSTTSVDLPVTTEIPSQPETPSPVIAVPEVMTPLLVESSTPLASENSQFAPADSDRSDPHTETTLACELPARIDPPEQTQVDQLPQTVGDLSEIFASELSAPQVAAPQMATLQLATLQLAASQLAAPPLAADASSVNSSASVVELTPDASTLGMLSSDATVVPSAEIVTEELPAEGKSQGGCTTPVESMPPAEAIDTVDAINSNVLTSDSLPPTLAADPAAAEIAALQEVLALSQLVQSSLRPHPDEKQSGVAETPAIPDPVTAPPVLSARPPVPVAVTVPVVVGMPRPADLPVERVSRLVPILGLTKSNQSSSGNAAAQPTIPPRASLVVPTVGNRANLNASTQKTGSVADRSVAKERTGATEPLASIRNLPPTETESLGLASPPLPRTGHLLGVEIGTNRTGFAICNSDQTIASLIESDKQSEPVDAPRVLRLVADHHIVGVVVGLPPLKGNEENPKSLECRKLAEWLSQLTRLPITFAEGRSASRFAAQILLQGYLDGRRTEKPKTLPGARVLTEC